MNNKQRDFELISNILLAVEESDAEKITTAESLTAHKLIKDYDKNVVNIHVRLLKNKELIDATLGDDLQNQNYQIRGMTWEGYDFLDKS